MEIAKSQIIDVLRERGDAHLAELAERELPDRVDPDRHDLVATFGVDPHALEPNLGDTAAELGLDDSAGGFA